jgi:hypothetical protein
MDNTRYRLVVGDVVELASHWSVGHGQKGDKAVITEILEGGVRIRFLNCKTGHLPRAHCAWIVAFNVPSYLKLVEGNRWLNLEE